MIPGYFMTVCSALLGATSVQSTKAYTDPASGIDYQRFTTNSARGFSFGIAFPSTPGTEFIGQIVAARKENGWVGVSFGGGMIGSLLLVVWLNGQDVVSSFRMTEGYLTPQPYYGVNGPVATKMSTVINDTHYSYTFRCQNCVSWANGRFDPAGYTTTMGWAVGSTAAGDAGNPSATLGFHGSGYGQYRVLLPETRSARYPTWLAAAGIVGGSEGTSPNSETNTTSTADGPGGSLTPLGEYDYIIVGGGAAGLVVADRLSETGKNVLLIERGPSSTYATGGTPGPAWLAGKNLTRFDVPGLCNQIWVDSSGVACNDVDTLAACVLGGGTAVNAGIFLKPPARDWDYNFPSEWKASDMASATERVFSRIPSTVNPSMDGIRYLQESYNVVSGFLAAAGWTPISANQSPDAKNRTFSRSPFMFANGERAGPLATYLQTALARNNFEMVLSTTVRRAIRTGGTITGVEVLATNGDGKTGLYTVTPGCGKVILSAGAFGTPKILFRSGIGPIDQLETIRTSEADAATMVSSDEWIALPVGYNILDHTNTDVVISHPSVASYDFHAAFDNPPPADRDLYLSHRAGILATAAPGPNTLFWESITPSDGTPRQLQWTARAEGSLGAKGQTLITLSQYLGTGAVSRGRVTVKQNLDMHVSASPYLADPSDVEAVILGVKSLMAAAAAANITFIHPAPTASAAEYVAGYAASRGSNHWMGSCRMGNEDGRKGGGRTGSVVDVDARVYGTDNLFVVDASVFPGHVSTNPLAGIMIVAERAVERILGMALAK